MRKSPAKRGRARLNAAQRGSVQLGSVGIVPMIVQILGRVPRLLRQTVRQLQCGCVCCGAVPLHPSLGFRLPFRKRSSRAFEFVAS